MIFSSTTRPQAISIPLNWNADYRDGKNFSEYDLDTQAKNDFYSIKTNEVVRFGLFGYGQKNFFEMSDGSFNLNGKRYDFTYTDGDKTYVLTANFEQKDLISYKEAYADYNNVQGNQMSHIKSINFGYKTIYKKDGVLIYFKPIVTYPMDNEKPFIEFKITSNKLLNGRFSILSKGEVVEEFEAPLEEDKAGVLIWTIK